MKRLARGAWLLLASGAFVPTGCVDTAPGRYVPVAHDAEPPSTKDSGEIDSCELCFKGPGGACRTQWDVCIRFPECVGLIDCSLQAGCFGILDLQERVACAGPCLATHPLPAGDPLVALADMNSCLDTGCADQCHPP